MLKVVFFRKIVFFFFFVLHRRDEGTWTINSAGTRVLTFARLHHVMYHQSGQSRPFYAAPARSVPLLCFGIVGRPAICQRYHKPGARTSTVPSSVTDSLTAQVLRRRNTGYPQPDSADPFAKQQRRKHLSAGIVMEGCQISAERSIDVVSGLNLPGKDNRKAQTRSDLGSRARCPGMV